MLRELGTSFVLFCRTGDSTGCAWFDITGEAAMAAAVTELHRLGNRRIGYVGGAARCNFAGQRENGFRAGVAGAGLAEDPALRSGRAMTHAEGRAATLELLGLPLPPTAFVFATDLAALGACEAAAMQGLGIGPKPSVISYDEFPEGACAEPGLTTYGVNSHHAGHWLAALLIRRVRGEPAEDLGEPASAKLVRR